MLHAIIMAGGAGSRFWPASRAVRPKQLLPLVGEQSMIQATLARLGDLAPPERVLVVTNVRLVEAMRAEAPLLPHAAIVGEPCKRDTAPCIGLAALLVSQADPDATMVVMPADHVIRPDAAFQQAIRAAVELVDAAPQRIVTFGVRPTYAAESFGYIEREAPLEGAAGGYRVLRFREKPKAETARQFLAAGGFYWNSGIFVWKARTILNALAVRQPDLHQRLQTIGAALGQPEYADVLEREFTAMPSISIDYAVMEHAPDVVVIEAPFEWDDVGSWQSIARLAGLDAQGNAVQGIHLGLGSSGCIIHGGEGHLVVTLGLKDCIVVHTPDATLVANKHDEESIRQVVKLLQERGWTEYL